MIELLTRLFARSEPVLAEAAPQDAAAIAALHGKSFNRGWSEDEIDRMLIERNVLTHRAMIGRRFAGFIMSRMAAGEAEILSVAVASARRGKGLARQLLNLHMRRLAGLGTRVVFLEVDEGNTAARRLYRRAGFQEAGRREGYYLDAKGNRSSALVLRRDLA
jgi:[ribosomal protein S18]-alanine N-acetyltransferase